MNWPDENAPKPSWIIWAEHGKADDPDADLSGGPSGAPRPLDPMNTCQAAAYLGVAQCTVNRAVLRGDLVPIERGGRGRWHRFGKADLDAYRERMETHDDHAGGGCQAAGARRQS